MSEKKGTAPKTRYGGDAYADRISPSLGSEKIGVATVGFDLNHDQSRRLIRALNSALDGGFGSVRLTLHRRRKPAGFQITVVEGTRRRPAAASEKRRTGIAPTGD